MITPVNSQVLLKPIVQDVSAGGIILPTADTANTLLPCEVMAVANTTTDPDEKPLLDQIKKATVVIIKMPYDKDYVETEEHGKLLLVDVTQVMAVSEWSAIPDKEVTPTVA